jgi:Tfp pilus assembly protein PilF
MFRLRSIFVAAALAAAVAMTGAAPIDPTRDDEVVETLPATGSRGQVRQWRRELARRPGDVALAVRVARHYLVQARVHGDPRFAGLAAAALRPWPDPDTAPPEVALLHAMLQQHQHEFDASATTLERLVARDPRHAQAWLTLATVRRVQGRYDASDAACRGLSGAGADLYAGACVAENDSLRGKFDAARARLTALAAAPRVDDGTRGWLLTTLAELEERAGDAKASDERWRAALGRDPSPYTTAAYADFLIAQRRGAQALQVLDRLPRSDAIVLRLAIAAAQMGTRARDNDAREMRERIALANQRPGAQTLHAREQAMFALWVDRDARRALTLARLNVSQQREPIDLLLLAKAARAAGDTQALREVDALRREVGLVDTRLDALTM